MTVKLVGRDDTAKTTGLAGYYIWMTKYTASASGICSEIQIRVGNSVSGNIIVGIYADSYGSPGALLATTASTSISSGSERSVTISLVSSISITNGQDYWIAANSSAANILCRKSETSVNKYKSYTYGALPDPAGSGYTNDTANSLIASGWGTTTQTVAPSGIASTEAFGSPTVTIAGNYILPAGIASLQAFGTPYIVIGLITCTGILSCEAFGAVMVLRDRIHLILEGSYETESQEVNRSYIVSQDLSGATVTASAITQAEVDLVGERLEVQHTPEAVTSAVAGYVAANVLAKARLGSKKGVITIPPHCGMELWDVVYIYDEYGNQSANYRVASYVFEYSVLESRWQHQIELCAP
jgi:hypothetical protein